MTLRCVVPIVEFAGTVEVDFVFYEFEDPKYDVDECRQRGMTFAAPMRVTPRLIVFEVDPDTEARSGLDIKEQDVYMGEMPLMTQNRSEEHTSELQSLMRIPSAVFGLKKKTHNITHPRYRQHYTQTQSI